MYELQASSPPRSEDRGARGAHVRRCRVVAGELQDQVGLGRRAHLGRSAREAGPGAVAALAGAQEVGQALELPAGAALQEVEGERVLGLEDGVALELSAPVTVGTLERQQVVAGRLHGVPYLPQLGGWRRSPSPATSPTHPQAALTEAQAQPLGADRR